MDDLAVITEIAAEHLLICEQMVDAQKNQSEVKIKESDLEKASIQQSAVIDSAIQKVQQKISAAAGAGGTSGAAGAPGAAGAAMHVRAQRVVRAIAASDSSPDPAAP